MDKKGIKDIKQYFKQEEIFVNGFYAGFISDENNSMEEVLNTNFSKVVKNTKKLQQEMESFGSVYAKSVTQYENDCTIVLPIYLDAQQQNSYTGEENIPLILQEIINQQKKNEKSYLHVSAVIDNVLYDATNFEQEYQRQIVYINCYGQLATNPTRIFDLLEEKADIVESLKNIINSLKSKNKAQLIFIQLRTSQQLITVLMPIIFDNVFYQINFTQQFQLHANLDEVLQKMNSSVSNITQNRIILFNSCIMQQNPMFFHSNSEILSPINYLQNITQAKQDVQLSQIINNSNTLATQLAFKTNTIYCKILYEYLINRKQPIVSILALQNIPQQLPFNILSSFAYGCSQGLCIFNYITGSGIKQIPLIAFQAIQNLGIEQLYIEKSDGETQTQNQTAPPPPPSPPKEEQPQIIEQKAAPPTPKEVKVLQSPKPLPVKNNTYQFKIPQNLPPITDFGIQHEILNKSQELMMLQAEIQQMNGFSQVVLQKQKTNQMLEENLKWKREQLQELQQKLDNEKKKYNRLNQEILSGEMLQRRYEQEVQAIEFAEAQK